MRMASIVGRPVRDEASAAGIGTVADLMIDADRLTAVAVAIAALPHEPTVETPPRPLAGLRSDEVLVTLADRGNLGLAPRRLVAATRLLNRRVETESGRDIGAVRDLHFDSVGRLIALELVNRGIGPRAHVHLTSGDSIASLSDVVQVDDAVLDEIAADYFSVL
jgi:uncharacterized protein YrrD